MTGQFSEFTRVQKGSVGETIVDRVLIARGFIPYSPADTGTPHPCDRICAAPRFGTMFAVDVKSKSARTYYPDTGINVPHYQQYRQLREIHRLETFIFFVDEHARRIYGNWLSKLERQRRIAHNGRQIDYPLTSSGVVYFPLVAMLDVCAITSEDARGLGAFTRRNYEYPSEPLFDRVESVSYQPPF